MRDIDRLDGDDRFDPQDEELMLEEERLDEVVAEELEDELKAEELELVDDDLPERQGLN